MPTPFPKAGTFQNELQISRAITTRRGDVETRELRYRDGRLARPSLSAMVGYATRTRRNAEAAQKAPLKVFAREDADGVRREKKRRADGDAPAVPGEASAHGRALSKEERRAAKKARKAEKSALMAQVQSARGVAPAEARLSAFLLPVAEPSLRAVLVRPVTVRAVRGADIVVVCEGCPCAWSGVPVALGGCKAASRRYIWLPESPTRLGAESCRPGEEGL